ncbi:metalloprotease (plasmid) [Pedobacter sp. BS3]|uniref:KPN_02809 family neutral zinc metallopeptidase n=1 Tax=Pedobacter sp. BS3 TaxID=2567937 RepID=UPI0011EE7D2F|nr:neutral zinc metallopeptidase [Pedobacter sp. BS3]TZF85566.1 metalloprotease [Pedobacter sp. BS3]
MRWLGKGSSNVEDRRGGGGLAIGGGLGVILVILGLFFGKDFTSLVSQLPVGDATQTEAKTGTPSDEEGKFVSGVLESTEMVWEKEFSNMGREYEKPRLVLFTNMVQSACGNASSAVGPFYCPGDHKVYIDLSFYNELKERFGAAGDFAQAYVIAHEVGHHVQNLLGISEKLDRVRGRVSEKEYNRLSVKLELQADFLAGVWANKARNLKEFELEPGDIEEALNAASAVGDDKLQQQAGGEVVPDAFTHGTSAQRMYWFKKGYETGDINQGDTFSSSEL